MSDEQNEQTTAPEAAPNIESLLKEADRAVERVKGMQALFSDTLKVIGTGNAAGAVAAATALNNFSSMSGLIKFGGACFMLGIVFFAVGFFCLFTMSVAQGRLAGAASRRKTKAFIDEQTNLAKGCVGPLVFCGYAGAVLFFVGIILAFVVLLSL